MAMRYPPRARHARAPSGSSTATAATGISNASTAIAQAPTTTTTTTTASGTTSSTPTDYRPHPNIRRNLFAQHSRRVVSGSSRSRMAEQTSHGNDTVGGGDGIGSAGLLRTTSSTSLSSKSAPTTAVSLSTAPVDNDIVARDRNGCYQVDVPTLPPSAGEDGEDDTSDPMEGIEDANTGPDVTTVDVGDEEIDGLNQEKLDESIKEMMRRHRNRQANGEQSEVYLLIQQSLANKVASLDEDNWMYEVEDGIRV